MAFIPESIIDEVAEALNQSDDAYERAVEELQHRQPVILASLLTDASTAFTRQEQEFMLYLTLVIYESIARVAGPPPAVTEEQLGEAEEHNWELLQNVSSPRFHERLDVFFADSRQEDLLAYVEDALSDEQDDDEWVTREGREAMFVSLKSIVDCLTGKELDVGS